MTLCINLLQIHHGGWPATGETVNSASLGTSGYQDLSSLQLIPFHRLSVRSEPPHNEQDVELIAYSIPSRCARPGRGVSKEHRFPRLLTRPRYTQSRLSFTILGGTAPPWIFTMDSHAKNLGILPPWLAFLNPDQVGVAESRCLSMSRRLLVRDVLPQSPPPARQPPAPVGEHFRSI